MILKIMVGGDHFYYEGDSIQVCWYASKKNAEAAGIAWTFRATRDSVKACHVAHVIRGEIVENVLFDCQAYLMEGGKTIDRIPDISEIE